MESGQLFEMIAVLLLEKRVVLLYDMGVFLLHVMVAGQLYYM